MPADSAGRFACDVESPAHEAGLLLPDVFGGREAFRESWVLAETAAKLLDIPILEWLHLRRSGLTPELPRESRGLLVTRCAGERVLAFGWIPGKGTKAGTTGPAGIESHAVFGFGRVLVTQDTNRDAAPRSVVPREDR